MKPFCTGENCQLKSICYLFQEHQRRKYNGESLAYSLVPQFSDNSCKNFQQIEYYGN